jgi:hypothetical protein
VPNVTALRAEDPDRIGRYRLDGRISGMPGAGPFYLATGPDGTELTIRLLRGAWTRDAAARDRFAAEAGSARRVAPFCAARVMDVGAGDDFAYLVSEYVPGRSLLEAVADSGRLRGPDLEALAIGGATGLAAVHQAGLVHGSFGPEHVIMSPLGPCIIEFGITPPYGQATPAADMLAWAQTMVFASMGRPPATLADLEVLPGVLREVVADCLSGDPGFRPEARSVVLDLLGDGAPEAGTLAEGSRRAAQLTEAAQRAAAEREAQQQARAAARSAQGSRAGQGGRAGRPAGAGGREPDGRDDERDATRAAPRRRVPVVPIGVAVVLTVAVAFVLVHLAGGGSSPGAAPGGGSPPSSSTSPVSSNDSAAASPGPAIPAALAGTWQGQVTLSVAGTNLDVQVSLAPGAGPNTIAYSSAGAPVCSGELTPEQAAASGALTLSQGIIKGQGKCGNGTVTLAASGSGLSFTFRGKGGAPITGSLARG